MQQMEVMTQLILARVVSGQLTSMEKEIDLGSWGKKTVAVLLCEFVIGHTNSLAGEISVLKGVAGSKGYPF